MTRLARALGCAIAVLWVAAVAPAFAAPAPALAGVAPTPAPASSTTVSLRSSFSPNRLGARGSLTFTLHYGGGESSAFFPGGPRVPAAVRRLSVRFPAGMGLDIPNLTTCSAASLRARGAQGCPAAARIGGGYALTELAAGSQILRERLTLTAYVGPLQGGRQTLAILARGFTPLGERLVFGGQMLFDHAPYGEALAMSLPPIVVVPESPFASPVVFSLTLGVKRGGARNRVIVPSRCPAGGFPFAAESSFADGSGAPALTHARCPR